MLNDFLRAALFSAAWVLGRFVGVVDLGRDGFTVLAIFEIFGVQEILLIFFKSFCFINSLAI